jgi:hypothetical protein
MKPAGVIRPLIRERHPFAVLAILAFLIPGLLSAAGATSSFTSFRLADGTTVICTGNGFVRVAKSAAGPDADVRHDKSDCCASGCVHAGGKTLPANAATPASVRLVFAVRLSPAAVTSEIASSPDAPGAIRAPPARSV